MRKTCIFHLYICRIIYFLGLMVPHMLTGEQMKHGMNLTRWTNTEYQYSDHVNKNIKTSKGASCTLLHLHFLEDPLWVSIKCNKSLIDSWVCKRSMNMTQCKYHKYKLQTTYLFLTICKKAFIFFSNLCYTGMNSELDHHC